MTLKKKENITAYTFLLLPLIFFIFVRFFPMVYSMVMSFTNWNLLSKESKFIGLKNFFDIFKDAVFIKSIGNTFKYVFVCMPATIVISLCIAIMLDKISVGKGLFRLLYVMPYVTPAVAVSWVWRWIFQPLPFGILNSFLVKLNLPTDLFLQNPKIALFCIAVANIWIELGYCVVIFLAGLQTIPKDVTEAARIDGANNFQVTMRIVLPLLLPVTSLLVVMQTIQNLRMFTLVFNMSYQATGGPLDSTKSLALYIYQKAFTKFDMGVASAASMVLFVIILIITQFQLKVLDKKLNY